ncbi:GDSL-type esterase/lipase family protein [Roseibium sp.]|uniref:SGNH/GDSL hydrolase family protein n=1 Tax=Roseibium sp. TaxID=1936156 RepID=UPI003A974CD9
MRIVRKYSIDLKAVGVLLLALVLAGFAHDLSGVAYAQSGSDLVRPAPGNSKSFNPFQPLLKLFGADTRKRRPARQSNEPRQASRPAGSPPRFEQVPKDPDAGVILVVGDRMARGVSDGLSFTLADKPMVMVEALTEDDAGLIGGDELDWEARVLARIRGGNVKAVVVMMGANDVGSALPGEPPVEFATDQWWATYQQRAERLLAAVRGERKPLLWVGLAPTGSELMNQDFTRLNALFSDVADAERGRFVDIWEVFLSEAGDYSSFGPDVDGKRQRLRTSDKIGFTWDGYRKVAFFAERQLSRILGGYGGLAFEGVEDDPNFIVLTGRTTSPEDELLGADAPVVEAGDEDPVNRFLVQGDPLKSFPGRVDYTGFASPADGS